MPTYIRNYLLNVKANLISTKGLDSSEKISRKILRLFGHKISPGLVRRYRRKFGKKIAWLSDIYTENF